MFVCHVVLLLMDSRLRGNEKKLYQIEKGKYKYPDQIYKVPVQPHFFNHFIMSPALISTQNHIKKYDNIDDYSLEYVKTVEACDKEKEVGKKATAIFVSDKVCPLNHANGIC